MHARTSSPVYIFHSGHPLVCGVLHKHRTGSILMPVEKDEGGGVRVGGNGIMRFRVNGANRVDFHTSMYNPRASWLTRRQ